MRSCATPGVRTGCLTAAAAGLLDRGVAAFALDVSCAELRALASRYGYADDSEVVAAGARAGQRGWYEREEFDTVYRWKSPRSFGKTASLDDEQIANATRTAFEQSDEEGRMDALLTLDGVGVPVASTLLAFAFLGDYPILDWRALESLGYTRQRTQYPTPFWLEYLQACREVAQRCGLDLRTLDKALWQLSRERNGR